jgi:hypothetical protein
VNLYPTTRHNVPKKIILFTVTSVRTSNSISLNASLYLAQNLMRLQRNNSNPNPR